MVEPEGTILVSKCTDIVIRHVAIGAGSSRLEDDDSTIHQTDKFRIHMFDAANELLGKRDVLATLYPGKQATI